MAYNSDGYIMIDFTEVDFRRTNQTIEGLFDRCQKVIGTNKFVIVINANNKTPLPSTVCITNGQYVIESVLYTFSISSNDNLHITKKTTPEELIDDSHVTLKTTYSSNKIVSLLDGKQNTLTAGDGISLVDNVISATGVKSFTYTGTGENTFEITIPDDVKYIVSIQGNVSVGEGVYNSWYTTSFINLSKLFSWLTIQGVVSGVGVANRYYSIVSFTNHKLKLFATASNGVLNISDVEYTVYYI